jgi:D-glycero-D-manno-heptose 1,7-bisphosphate phosphatase
MRYAKAAIVDRDGTLIDVVRDEETGAICPAFHPGQLKLLPGVVEGLAALRDAGYALCVATNQPGPAKGQFSRAAVERTNLALTELLAGHGIELSAFEVCLHHPTGGPGGDPALVQACDCRKPQPGMLVRALAKLGVAASASWMIGDSPMDVQAARAAGTRAALIWLMNRCELCPLRDGPGVVPDLAGSRFDQIASEIIRASA